MLATHDMHVLFPKAVMLTFATAAAMAGCSANLPLSTGSTAAPTTSLAANSDAALGSGFGTGVSAAPVDVYQRIARQASRCWFAQDSTLHGTHMFHATAAPLSDGGRVEIAIHKREANIKKPWGARAYIIELTGSTTTYINFKNISLDLPTQDKIKSDAFAWANNRQQCSTRISPATAVIPVPAGKTAPLNKAGRSAAR
ncbi:MAG TPA: hypothetical protein VMX97_08915 [Hyphomicrobiaceae bacterium]|nr:hypothetical protein [Hyphomicrobiaceae bacterium]